MFKSVESIRELDNVTIALTDYGFWDIETNQTKDVTYSYRGMKTHQDVDPGGYAHLETKIVLPEFNADGNAKVVEYNKAWNLDGTETFYQYENTKFVKDLVLDSESHSFIGAAASGNFAVYDVSEKEPAYLLVGIGSDEFRRLLYSDSALSGIFTQWLYDQVTDPGKGQHWIDGIAGDVDSLVEQYNTLSITDAIYPLSNWNDGISSNLGTIKDVVTNRSGQDDYPDLQKYCTRLYRLSKSDNLDLDWLMGSDSEDKLKDLIEKWFANQE